jgi:hypothetical protein
MFCIPVRLCPSSPPPPFSHKGRRGSLGVLMDETGDGTQGRAKKSTPVRCTRGGAVGDARTRGGAAGEDASRPAWRN